MNTSELTAASVAEILRYVPTRPDYPTWIRVIAAVGSVLTHEDAVTVLAAWSPEESPGEYTRKLRNPLKQVGIGSLIHLAKEHGFDAKTFSRNPTNSIPVRLCYPGKQSGFCKVQPTPIIPAAITKRGSMDSTTGQQWDEGVDYLRNNPDVCAKIDSWRGYQSGTTAELAESNLMAAPRVWRRRTLAFIVTGHDGCRLGFHARHRDYARQRASWSFHPKGILALPFVMGAGFACYAKRVMVFEGQWDCIAMCSALGWLAHDTSFDEHTIMFGTRGTSPTTLFSEWFDVIPANAEWFLFRDADKAGEAWFGFAETLKARGRKVRLCRPAAGKDVNDVLKGKTITPDAIFS